jgi:hypothetical protein
MSRAARARRDSFVSNQPHGPARYSTRLRVIASVSGIAAPLAESAVRLSMRCSMFVTMESRGTFKRLGDLTARIAWRLARRHGNLGDRLSEGLVSGRPGNEGDEIIADPEREFGERRDGIGIKGAAKYAAAKVARGGASRTEIQIAWRLAPSRATARQRPRC